MIFTKQGYRCAILLLTLLLISTLPHRVLHFDDAWGAELAYRLLRDGYAHTELFQGLGDGAGQHAYVFHKAFTYIQAGLLGLIGFSVYSVKAMGLIFSLIGLLLLLRNFRGRQEAQWLAAYLYIGCGTLMSAAFIGRPEPLAMSAGLTSFLLLKYAQGRKHLLVWSGVFAGLAGLAHLHGLIFLLSGGLWLMFQRARPTSLLAFGAAGTTVLALYPLDAIINHQLATLLRQFFTAPVTQASQHGLGKVTLLLHYQAVYFHSEGEAILTVLLFLVVGLTWKRGPLAHPARWSMSQQYTTLLVLTFWVVCARADSYYFLLLAPFFIIVVVDSLLSSWVSLAPWRQATLRGLLLLYPIGAVTRAYHLWQESSQQPWPVTENVCLAHFMPLKGSIAIVPLDFVFNEISQYRLRGLTAYAMRNRTQYHDTLSVNGFFALAAQDSAQYVVTDFRSGNDVFRVPANAPARIGHYRRVYQDHWHSVYSRVDAMPSQ